MTSTSIITMFRVGPANNRTNETGKMEVEKSMVPKVVLVLVSIIEQTKKLKQKWNFIQL